MTDLLEALTCPRPEDTKYHVEKYLQIVCKNGKAKTVFFLKDGEKDFAAHRSFFIQNFIDAFATSFQIKSLVIKINKLC